MDSSAVICRWVLCFVATLCLNSNNCYLVMLFTIFSAILVDKVSVKWYTDVCIMFAFALKKYFVTKAKLNYSKLWSAEIEIVIWRKLVNNVLSKRNLQYLE